ncbi:CD3337/EF1877 family mobilome membrane protein [Leuconostoc mesenteroides]|uniref:CD3337/EF1877 family mobilome membrane protein n=1 Tax=Leuconostoc mesenteroides TaxID=1245 RepID=UPI003889871F
MKKIRVVLAVLLGTAFFVPASVIVLPNITPVVRADNIVDDVNKAVKDVVDDVTGKPQYSEEKIKNMLNANNIDWVNQNILKNFGAYNQGGGITDFSLNTAHTLSDIFMSVNLYVVYPIFDVALSKMFDLANITTGINDIFGSVQTFTKQTWAGEVFKQLLYLAFGVGIVWAFVKSVTIGGGFKAIMSVLLVAILGGAWIGAGGVVLTKINTMTSTAQTVIFTETTNINGRISGTDNSFQKAIRKDYFSKAVIRPYMLANFGKTELNQAEKQGSYRLIGGKVTGNTVSDLAKHNDYLSKDGGYEWYQVAVSGMSSLMSLAYGIPLLMIGLFNLVLQLGAILLYYLAPFTVLLSLIPKFANSALKTALGAMGMLFGKVSLLFAIMFVSWIGNITDTIIPVTSSATALLNSVVYFLLMYLMWKNKTFLVQTITGSSMANQALNKISLTRAGQQALNAGSEMADSARNGVNSLKGLSGRFGRKPDDENNTNQPDGTFKSDDDNNNQGKNGNEPDEQELRELAEQRKAEREARLADELERQRLENDELDNDEFNNDEPEKKRFGDIADDETLPKYRRRDYLVGHIGQSDNSDDSSKDNHELLERSRHNRVAEDEDTSEMAEKRRQARSSELHHEPVIKDKSSYPEIDKTTGRNLDEVFNEQADIKARDKAELDKEL